MEVRLFKLINGNELIAQLLKEVHNGYEVKRPLAIGIMHDASGNPSLGFSEWSVTADQSKPITILSSALVSLPYSAHAEIENSYTQQVTGLALPARANGQILMG